MSFRAALYWTPEPTDPLAQAGNTWLGWDAEHATAVAQPDIEGLAEATAAPRLYGFHATLRPPMRLSTGWEEFMEAAQQVAATVAPFDLPALHVANNAGFLALQEAVRCPNLQKLADSCVAGTERHRLRTDAAELAKRRAAGLSAAQDALLLQWGYPYVMGEWRFHMTLSKRLDPASLARLHPAAQAHFAAPLAVARRVSSITVLTQLHGAAFLVADRIALMG